MGDSMIHAALINGLESRWRCSTRSRPQSTLLQRTMDMITQIEEDRCNLQTNAYSVASIVASNATVIRDRRSEQRGSSNHPLRLSRVTLAQTERAHRQWRVSNALIVLHKKPQRGVEPLTQRPQNAVIAQCTSHLRHIALR